VSKVSRRRGFVSEGFLPSGTSGAGGGPPAVLVSIEVTPVDPTWRPDDAGDRLQFAATGHYSDASTADLTASVVWTSGTTATATINATGEATAVRAYDLTTLGAPGTSTITAAAGAISGNSVLSVDTERDSTADKRTPINAYQFALLEEPVDGIYLCQEDGVTAGQINLNDSGPVPVALVPLNSPNYQIIRPLMERAAVRLNDGVTNQRFTAGSGVGPNPATTPTIWTWFFDLTELPAAGRTLFVNGAGGNTVQQLTTGVLRKATPGTNADDSTTRPDVDDALHVMSVLHDPVGSRAGLYTDEERTPGVYGAATDGIKGLGSATPPLMHVYYGIRQDGVNGQRTEAQIKALHQKLNFTVPWTPVP
jgi:hypothetical protein